MLEVGDRQLDIRTLERVVYPRAGTTKGELLDYYIRIAPVMLAHLRDRLLHMHRYPEVDDSELLIETGDFQQSPDRVPAHDREAEAVGRRAVGKPVHERDASGVGEVQLAAVEHKQRDPAAQDLVDGVVRARGRTGGVS